MFAVTTDFPLASARRSRSRAGLHASHELADDVDAGVVDDGAGIVGETVLWERKAPVSGGIADGHADHLEAHARLASHVFPVLVQEPDHGGAHVAAPEQTDAHGPLILRLRSFDPHPSLPIQAAMSNSSS